MNLSSFAPARIALESVVLVAGAFLMVQPAFGAPPDLVPVPVTVVSPLPIPVTGPAGGNLSVRDVDNPARSPFQVTLCGQAGANACTSLQSTTQVPSNRRMVIEYISGSCTRNGDNTLIHVNLGTVAGGTGAEHKVQFGLDPLSLSFLQASQSVRIYADAGTTVGMNTTFGFGAGPGSASCRITLSGYTVAF